MGQSSRGENYVKEEKKLLKDEGVWYLAITVHYRNYALHLFAKFPTIMWMKVIRVDKIISSHWIEQDIK
jgi:hypothetical protein